VRSPSGELTKLYYDDAGLLYALQRGAARFYVATDQIGSPRLVLDSSGATVREIAYDAFGRVRSDSGGFDLPIGFAGGLADPATGLVRFGYRDYDTMTGRWTAKDPAFFGGSPYNLYSYAGSEPVGTRDPSGLSVSVCWAGVYGFGGPSPKAISHWWLETSTIKRGMGSTSGVLGVGWVDQAYKYERFSNPGEITCEEQEGIDEECVNRMTTGDLGTYGFIVNNCHDAVEDVLEKCGPKPSDPPTWQEPGYEFRGPLWIR
jgi:RHS repeat-associated protein